MSIVRSPLGEKPRRTAGDATRRTFRSLRVRNYRLFFSGQLVSVSGTWMQTVAQNWLVLNLTGSGLDLGVTVALQFLPMLLFGMWGGVIADRFDKRRVLIAAQAAAGILALVLWGLVTADVVQLWMVEVLAFLLGLVQAVDMPTRQSFVTEMVGPDELPNAVGLNSAMFNAGRLIGPALAGVVISTAGVGLAFLINAGSYVPVMFALAAMRPDELHRHHGPDGFGTARRPGQIRDGLRYVWGHRQLRSTLLLVAVVGLFGLNFQVVLPLLARYTFDGGPRLYGALAGAMAFGSLLGALVAAGRAQPSRRLLVGSGAAFGALVMASAAAPTAVTAGALLLGAGVAVMLFLATANVTLQLNSEPAMRGRVMALYGLVFLGSTPLGGPLLGWMSGTWGARSGLVAGGAASLAASLAAAILPGVRRRRLGAAQPLRPARASSRVWMEASEANSTAGPRTPAARHPSACGDRER